MEVAFGLSPRIGERERFDQGEMRGVQGLADRDDAGASGQLHHLFYEAGHLFIGEAGAIQIDRGRPGEIGFFHLAAFERDPIGSREPCDEAGEADERRNPFDARRFASGRVGYPKAPRSPPRSQIEPMVCRREAAFTGDRLEGCKRGFSIAVDLFFAPFLQKFTAGAVRIGKEGGESEEETNLTN